MKERKRKMVVLSLVGVLLLVGVISVSYALWERLFTQSDENRITTLNCFDITYSNESSATTLNGAVPIKEEDGLKLEPYKITIKNTCDTNAKYNVILNKKKGSTLDNKFVRAAVDKKTILLSEAQPIEKRSIQGFDNEASYIIGSGFVTGKQEKTIEIRSWMDWETQPSEGQNKTFTYKITIETGATNEEVPIEPTLGETIIASQSINEDITDFTNKLSDWKLNQNVYIDANETCNMIGEGICVTKNYSDIYFENQDDLTMNNAICNVTEPTEYIDYYTFGTCDNISGYEIYKIKEVSGSTITKADWQYYVLKEGEGLVKTADDDGTSYIYRGQINNNYVSFADRLWRIVRINGDGTIRIILNDKDTGLPNMTFNSTYNNPKYVGYTYDNKQYCTSDNPCISDYNGNGWTNSANMGTSSTIKGKLEEWYQTNLKNLDDKIALTKYCNDTTTGSIDSGTTYYGARERIVNNSTATLKCSDTDKNYGGLYKLKIGLLSADECMYGGLAPNSSKFNYLYHSYNWWTMSPDYSYSSDAYEFGGGGYLNYSSVYSSYAVLPVINLKSDVTVTGTGTQSDPYVVQ